MTRFWRVLPFFAIVSLFLYVANLVVYEALADMFLITAWWHLLALGTVLGILSGSFVAATLVGMWYYNAFTRLYYTFSAVWIGCSVYLFFASVIYGLLVLFTGTLQNLIGQILIGGALAASLYGAVHARNLHVKNVDVTIAHLPHLWHGRRAVWISDLHLGQLNGPGFARKIAQKINTLAPDIIFVGGDLYDGTQAPDLHQLAAPLKNLTAPLGTYFITGNHEEFGDAGAFTAAARHLGMHVLQDALVEIDGLQLIGVDYQNASHKERFKNILSKLSIDPTKPSILLKHEPKDLDMAHAAGITLQISGHTHRGQQWPLGYIAQLIYKGFAYGLKNFDGMQVYTSSGTGTWGPPLRVGTNSEIVLFTFGSSR